MMVSSATVLVFVYLLAEQPHSKDSPNKAKKSSKSQQTLDIPDFCTPLPFPRNYRNISEKGINYSEKLGANR